MEPGTQDQLPRTRLQRGVRLAGTGLLTGCAGMVILGTTVLADQLHGPRYLLYWSWCFLLAVGAIVAAMWDVILVRRAFRRTRRELFREKFMTDQFAAKRPDEQRK